MDLDFSEIYPRENIDLSPDNVTLCRFLLNGTFMQYHNRPYLSHLGGLYKNSQMKWNP